VKFKNHISIISRSKRFFRNFFSKIKLGGQGLLTDKENFFFEPPNKKLFKKEKDFFLEKTKNFFKKFFCCFLDQVHIKYYVLMKNILILHLPAKNFFWKSVLIY